MTTQTLTQVDPKQFLQTTAPTATGTQRLDTKVSAVAVSNDFEGRLSVTTAEGDKITLAADLEYDFRAVAYSSKLQTDNGTVDVNATSVEASLKREFGVTVEGDLNEQELHDLEKLFRKVSSIFRKFISGDDEEALAKASKLAERLGRLETLSSLDLSVNVERSVTALVAQIESETTGQPALPRPQEAPSQAAQPLTVTPGGAPAAAAAIPQPSTGTTAPTAPSSTATAEHSGDGIHLTAQPEANQQPASLVQQVLESFKHTQVETQKIQKYLPSFLEHLRESLAKALPERQENATAQNAEHSANPEAPTTTSSLLVSYQAVRSTSFSLSIHS